MIIEGWALWRHSFDEGAPTPATPSASAGIFGADGRSNAAAGAGAGSAAGAAANSAVGSAAGAAANSAVGSAAASEANTATTPAAGTPAAENANATWTRGRFEVSGGVIHRLADGDARPADMRGAYLLPGLVDVHAHIGIGPDGPASDELQRDHVAQQTAAGVTLVRDCGSPVDESWMRERTDVPLLIRAGQHIARPKRYIRGLSIDVEDVSTLPEVVAGQARAGDGWVKLVGDWIDRSLGADADLKPLWPTEVLRDAVAAAHENGARVAVHTFGHETIDGLLEAGVDDIEHGTGMDRDHLAEARRRGITVTPTLMQVELFADFAAAGASKFPRYADTMQRMWVRRAERAAALFDSGIRLLPGTDAGGYQAHGRIAQELGMWQDLGVEPGRILDLATWSVRDYLGVPSLGDGSPADVVVVDEDPRDDVRALASPALVLRGGAVVGGTLSAARGGDNGRD